MPKGIRRTPAPDINQLAHHLVDPSTKSEDVKNSETAASESPEEQMRRQIMREMGARGGRKGGVARAARMTREQRSESASKAAKKRWGKE
jgi:hypothetical protein